MVRLKFSIELNYEIDNAPADFILNIQAAQTHSQSLVAENLQLSQSVPVSFYTDPANGNRYARLRAQPGSLMVRYDATVDIVHYMASPDSIQEIPIAELPWEALPYIYPSRYCQSDRLQQLVNTEFGGLQPGYRRVAAIRDWVNRRTRFLPGSSNVTTSSADTLDGQAGVCRDFAHLMIALCRALNIPARFATGIDYGADPIFGPTDFHAYVETYLSGRWYLFDATNIAMPTGLIRLGVGRDAADVAFATIFGTVRSGSPIIDIQGVEDNDQGIVLPYVSVDAISTAD